MTKSFYKQKNITYLTIFFIINIVIILFLCIYYQQKKVESSNISLDNQTRKGFDYRRDNLEKEKLFPPPSHLLPPPRESKEKNPKEIILTDQEIIERIQTQNKWKIEVLPHLLTNKKIKKKINKFLSDFYYQFLREGLQKHEEEWKMKVIRPQKVLGRFTTKDTWENDVEYCKEVHPEIKEAGIHWQGFEGWLAENEEERSNKTLMGLCITNSKGKGGWISDRSEIIWSDWKGRKIRKEDKETSCHWTYRWIAIKLKPELFFNQHDTWIEITNNSPKKIFYIGWEGLVETMAHELTHAIVNTLIIDGKLYGLDKEGHGPLHDDFTERIKSMIEKSPECKELWKWWHELK